MNPFCFSAQCSVCGGDGMATPSAMKSLWYGGSVSHTDPAVCRDTLARAQRKRERLDTYDALAFAIG